MVHQALKLDDAQIAKGRELSEKSLEFLHEKFTEQSDLSSEERMSKMAHIINDANAKDLEVAREFLKPEQIARLGQLARQSRGVLAFMDPATVSRLKLTDAQRDEFDKLFGESLGELKTMRLGSAERDEAMKKVRTFERRFVERGEAKLTDEQRKVWKELIGEWIDM